LHDQRPAPASAATWRVRPTRPFLRAARRAHRGSRCRCGQSHIASSDSTWSVARAKLALARRFCLRRWMWYAFPTDPTRVRCRFCLRLPLSIHQCSNHGFWLWKRDLSDWRRFNDRHPVKGAGAVHSIAVLRRNQAPSARDHARSEFPTGTSGLCSTVNCRFFLTVARPIVRLPIPNIDGAHPAAPCAVGDRQRSASTLAGRSGTRASLGQLQRPPVANARWAEGELPGVRGQIMGSPRASRCPPRAKAGSG